MFHYVNAITNTKGDALIGYYVKLRNSAGETVSLYSDESSTAIETVSGLENAAKVDSNGNASFYVLDGEYTIDIYATDGTTLVGTYPNIPMSSVGMRQVATAADLANLETDAPAILTLSGSQGIFIFDSTDLSAAVAADSGQSTYIAPASDTTGESGAWVRMGSSPVDVEPDGIINGCGVSYVGNLDFAMTAGTYRLNGITYEAEAQEVSLDAADASLDRIDILYLDTNGVLDVLTGTPAATPSRPTLDPSSQLEVTFVQVPAAATSLSGITNEDIYREGADWTETSSNAAIVIDSTTNPYAGTKHIEATAAPVGAYIKFVRSSAMAFGSDGNLAFRLRSKGGWNTTQSLMIQWYNAGVAVGSPVNLKYNLYGFNSNEITEHQLIIISKALFAIASDSEIDELRFTVVGSSSGWDMDEVILQTTGDTILPFYPTGLTFAQLDTRYLQRTNCLVEFIDPTLAAAARNNIDVYSQAEVDSLIAASGGGDMLSTNNLSDVANAATARSNLSAAAKSQAEEQISGFIASPSDKSYKLAVKMAHAGTITETTTISASGTCTATFKVNSTALGGTANSVSSSEVSQSHASSNTFAAGDDIVLTVSSNSSCADLSFTIKYTRTLS